MPDHQSHMNPEELAELIRQYLAGELDDKAMHQLERRALDDPFLAEALEGYEQHAPDQLSNQLALEDALNKRIANVSSPAGGTGRIRNLYRIAAAAAIILLMGVGWYLVEQSRQKSPDIAAIPSIRMAPDTAPVPAPAIAPPPPLEETSIYADKKAAAPAKKDKPEKVTAVTPPPAAPLAEAAKPATADDARVSKDVKGRMSMVQAQKTVQDSSFQGYFNYSQNKPADPNAFILPDSLKRIDLADFRRGQDQAALRADTNMRVNLGIATIRENAADNERSELTITSAKGRKDTNVRIRGNSSLSEVVVVKGTSKRPADEEATTADYILPLPVNGQTAYDSYLKSNIRNPDNIKGTVKVSFVVMPDGSLQDIRIKSHLTKECDDEAIRLIKEGPAWKPSSDGKATRVTKKIKFTATKN